MKTFKAFSSLAFAGLVMASAAVCSAQNVVAAKFGSSPAAGQSFTVNLVNSGSESSIAGFAFKLKYDPSQVSIAGVKDNTGQSAAKIQYTLGKETINADGSAQAVLTATTIKNLTNAGNLAEVKFVKKASYQAPFKLQVEDRETKPVVDGLQGASLENVEHTFDVSQLSQ